MKGVILGISSIYDGSSSEKVAKLSINPNFRPITAEDIGKSVIIDTFNQNKITYEIDKIKNAEIRDAVNRALAEGRMWLRPAEEDKVKNFYELELAHVLNVTAFLKKHGFEIPEGEAVIHGSYSCIADQLCVWQIPHYYISGKSSSYFSIPITPERQEEALAEIKEYKAAHGIS